MKQVLGKLVYDTNKAEGEIKIDWGKMPTDLMMLDIIGDWHWELKDLYHQKEQEVFPKSEGANDDYEANR